MARTWFTAQNTGGTLSPADLTILNRAVRLCVGTSGEPTRDVLLQIRQAYKTGMSAKDIVLAVGLATADAGCILP